jgi:hypothetical protein
MAQADSVMTSVARSAFFEDMNSLVVVAGKGFSGCCLAALSFGRGNSALHPEPMVAIGLRFATLLVSFVSEE